MVHGENAYDRLNQIDECDELEEMKLEDKKCELSILEDKIIWDKSTLEIINNAKNLQRKCHENRHVMRYALFAARAQIYRRIDDICNDIKNLDLVQKDVESNSTSTLLEVIITKLMSQRDTLEDLLIQIRELLDLQCIHKWGAKFRFKDFNTDCDYTDDHEPSRNPESIFIQFFSPFESSPMIRTPEDRPLVTDDLPAEAAGFRRLNRLGADRIFNRNFIRDMDEME